MTRFGKSRFAAVFGAVLLLGLVVVGTLPSSAASTKAPVLIATPRAKLTNGKVVVVRGSHFTSGDEIMLLECQRTASLIIGCDPLTTAPATVTSTGQILATQVTVATGEVGTGTCGTSKSDSKDCAIMAEDLGSLLSGGGLSLQTFVASANIAFKAGGSTTTTTTTTTTTLPPVTIPTLPIPTLPTLSTRR